MRCFSASKYNIIKVTPEQFGYKDRGILKWQGLLLSDHLEALKREKINERYLEVKAKEEMTVEEISTILFNAYNTGSPILLQANVIKGKNGYHYKDLACKVLGYDDEIHLQLKDGRTVNCTLDQIRKVEFMNSLDWFEKI